MATPKDPNKTLLEEQALIDEAARVEAGKVATVRDGDTAAGYTITVADGVITAITPI